MSSVCITIPDSLYYVLIVGSVGAAISALGTICGFSCPFVSNMLQNRSIQRTNGLLDVVIDQIAIQRNQVNNV